MDQQPGPGHQGPGALTPDRARRLPIEREDDLQLEALAHSTISCRTAVAPAGPGTTRSQWSKSPDGASGDQTPTDQCGMSRVETYSNMGRSFSSSPKQITPPGSSFGM